jgi:hypothetical protein
MTIRIQKNNPPKRLWGIYYFDTNQGCRVRYMNIGFESEEAANAEKKLIIEAQKKRHKIHPNKKYIKVKEIKLKKS